MEYYERDADGEGPGPSRIVSDASKPSSSKASHPSFIPLVPVSLQQQPDQTHGGSRQKTATTVKNIAKFLLLKQYWIPCVCECVYVCARVCARARVCV